MLSVGSVDSVTVPTNFSIASWSLNGNAEESFGYVLGTGLGLGFPNASRPLYATSFDPLDASDACQPLPSTTPNLSGYYVLVRRGNCTFDEKYANVQQFGGVYIIFYNNVPTVPFAVNVGRNSAMMVSEELGQQWLEHLIAGADVSVKTLPKSASPSTFLPVANNLTGGFMSYFSTWGPDYEVGITPVVSAPGGTILSTYPIKMGGYAVLSGTSMATPYIASVKIIIDVEKIC